MFENKGVFPLRRLALRVSWNFAKVATYRFPLIFLFFIKDVKDSNYTFEAYKSWYIKTKELEMFWDGRDSYLILWDISTGDRKTLKIENSDITNFKLIEEYLEIISRN